MGADAFDLLVHADMVGAVVAADMLLMCCGVLTVAALHWLATREPAEA